MLIRPAETRDIPAILELMKVSLGESMIPKSERLWKWKHELNPFGPSYVLLAEENNMLIGLRAFMQWQWRQQGKIFKAIRAVDTATHPAHQGKGIFTKLTLQLLTFCKGEKIDFVFNTPNELSRPGYLKMGWVQQGKLPLKIKLLHPLNLGWSRLFNKKKYAHDVSEPVEPDTRVIHLFDKLTLPETRLLHTPLTSQYLSWRYVDNPLFNYIYFSDHKNYVLISRLKIHSFCRELRVVDFVLLNPRESTGINAHIKKEVTGFCKANKIDFISLSGLQFHSYHPCFNWMGILPIRYFGPIITLRNVNIENEFGNLVKFDNWNYSLGDLELF